MSITINIFVLAAIVVLALMGGFWIGRSVKWMMADTESRISEGENAEEYTDIDNTLSEERSPRKLKNNGKRIPIGWEIGSPVSGMVQSINDGARKGVKIQPEKGVLYAPASGKIIRLYPMGNSMLLRTDFGVELLLCVGVAGEELHSVFYRSGVIQNEIVTKGKVLLEFDMEGMYNEGIDTAVSLTVETADVCRNITVAQQSQVKVGEALFVCDSHRG